MDNFRKKLRGGLLIVGGIILVAVIFMSIMSRVITNASDRALDLKRELALKESAIGSLAALKADAARAEKIRPRLDALVPPKDSFINFPSEIASLAKNNKVTARASLVGEAAANDTAPAGFLFEIITASDYSSFVTFLRALEQRPSLIRFTSADVVRNERNAFDGMIRGQLFFQ